MGKTREQREAVAEAARELNRLREEWLYPPEWFREEVRTFPASVLGPWAGFVSGANGHGVGLARVPHLVPRDLDMTVFVERDGQKRAFRLRDELPRRTLTQLYNERPAWLVEAHRNLDRAVMRCYGWREELDEISDEEILSRLLALNHQRAGVVHGLA